MNTTRSGPRGPAGSLAALACGTIAGALTLSAGWAHAQQVWRSTGPDGRVTFTDVPPDPRTAQPVQSGSISPDGNPTLPFTLREAVNRYPVVIYTGTNCQPCEAARALLSRRGIPFQERTIATADDLAALQRLAGDGQVPVLNIGRQQIKGFSSDEWNQYLDAAGYPRSSVLPPSYRQALPSPLAPRNTTAAAPVPPVGATGARPGEIGAGSVPPAPPALVPMPMPSPPPPPAPRADPSNRGGIIF